MKVVRKVEEKVIGFGSIIFQVTLTIVEGSEVLSHSSSLGRGGGGGEEEEGGERAGGGGKGGGRDRMGGEAVVGGGEKSM